MKFPQVSLRVGNLIWAQNSMAEFIRVSIAGKCFDILDLIFRNFVGRHERLEFQFITLYAFGFKYVSGDKNWDFVTLFSEK